MLGILGVIVVLLNMRSVPPVRFVGIGIGAYDHLPPNAGGRNDVVSLQEHFQLLHEQFPDRFREVRPFDDNLTASTLLGQLRDQLNEARDETLFVYCSALGYVAPENHGTVQILAIHAEPESLLRDGDEGRVPVADLLASLSQTPAKRVLVFLDLTRLDPHPRLGVLDWDVAEELERELAALVQVQDSSSGQPGNRSTSGSPRITVVCASSPGEFSWTDGSGNETHSVSWQCPANCD